MTTYMVSRYRMRIDPVQVDVTELGESRVITHRPPEVELDMNIYTEDDAIIAVRSFFKEVNKLEREDSEAT